MNAQLDPNSMLRPGRTIEGISAILLPFQGSGAIDWAGFEAHVARTHNAGLTPAVNMDTGFGNLLPNKDKAEVLRRTESIVGNSFVAGAFVKDETGANFNGNAYAEAMEPILQHGGTPVIFQSYGLTELPDAEIAPAYDAIGRYCERFIGFELGTMFAPFGKIYSAVVYQELLQVQRCIGAKHSSLRRDLEWRRLQLRDELRPDFKVYTGNDLAIDMVCYGSDYLLGLSTFAPELFALRDRYWAENDAQFYELNDVLQYLGFLAFRDPVPAYKHSAAMLFKLRGWISCDNTHPQSATRPDSDRAILAEWLTKIERFS